MARRKKRMHFKGTSVQHRSDAGHHAKEARTYAQMARSAAARGDCARAISTFGIAAFHAGQAIGNRKWIKGKRGFRHAGGSHIGGRIASLQGRILQACVKR